MTDSLALSQVQSKQFLGIYIPTFKRYDQFSRLLNQLSREVELLSESDQGRVQIAIFENPSEDSNSKEYVVRQAVFGEARVSWVLNKNNIGGDANIEQAYSAGRSCEYCWVIGDDEQLLPGALSNIIDYLDRNPACGLLLLRDTTYSISDKILDQRRFKNYCDFVSEVCALQPHLIIAHTLISANVVRGDLYDIIQSQKERKIFSPRAGLSYSFAHSVGFLSGLSCREDLSVDLLVSPVIDTSKRAPPEWGSDTSGLSEWESMKRLYRHHLYWISHEFGLDIEKIRSHSSMKNIFGDRSRQDIFAIESQMLRKLASNAKKLLRLIARVLR